MTRKVQKGPSERIAHHLSALAAAKTAAPATSERPAAAPPRHAPSASIARNAAGIDELHQRVDVVGRLDAAARALRALVARPRGALRRASEPKTDDDDAGSGTLRASAGLPVTRPTSQSPARAMTARSTPGARRAATAAASTAARRRHERAQRAIEPPLAARRRGAVAPRAARGRRVHPCASACSAACAASSPPRTAKRRPSPVIGSMNPAASPASSRPSIGGAARRRRPADRARPAARRAARRRSGRAAADRAASSRVSSAAGSRERRRRRARRPHQADVRQAARHRRDADVAAARTCISPSDRRRS